MSFVDCFCVCSAHKVLVLAVTCISSVSSDSDVLSCICVIIAKM
jgi:hypothetical protein